MALQGKTPRSAELFSVFTYFNDRDLKETAFSWLIGDPTLSKETLERLGVLGPIGEQDALQALQFLAGLFAFAEMPLLIYLDQIERLVLDVDLQASEQNRGRL